MGYLGYQVLTNFSTITKVDNWRVLGPFHDCWENAIHNEKCCWGYSLGFALKRAFFSAGTGRPMLKHRAIASMERAADLLAVF